MEVLLVDHCFLRGKLAPKLVLQALWGRRGRSEAKVNVGVMQLLLDICIFVVDITYLPEDDVAILNQLQISVALRQTG